MGPTLGQFLEGVFVAAMVAALFPITLFSLYWPPQLQATIFWLGFTACMAAAIAFPVIRRLIGVVAYGKPHADHAYGEK